jgi:hypothetical protein
LKGNFNACFGSSGVTEKNTRKDISIVPIGCTFVAKSGVWGENKARKDEVVFAHKLIPVSAYYQQVHPAGHEEGGVP